MAAGKTLIGLLIVALTVLVAVAPANAGKPKSGNWFSELVDPDDEDNLSSIQFRVANGKKLKTLTIYWRCGNKSGYHNFTNLPIPIGINKQKKFKVIGATTPPTGQTTTDFTLKGKFVSGKEAKYSMQLKGCGSATRGKLTYAGS